MATVTVKPPEEKDPLDVVDGAGSGSDPDVDTSNTIITALVTEGEQWLTSGTPSQ